MNEVEDRPTVVSRVSTIGSRGMSDERGPMRSTHAFGVGAIAFGACAIGAAALGALAIGRLAVGAFAMTRGHVRTLTVDDLQVRRLHIGELIVNSSR